MTTKAKIAAALRRVDWFSAAALLLWLVLGLAALVFDL